MRILLLNPNTNGAMTAKVAEALQPHLPEGTGIVQASAQFGAPAIATRASFAVGGHAALDVFARHAGQAWDAVLLACFGDPAILALREVSAVPVLGMAEASMRLAARSDGPFSIVTGGALWQPMLTEFAASLDLAGRLASVRTTKATGGEMFADPEAALPELLARITECAGDGARRVVLGGAGLAGFAARLRPLSPLPIIDCVEALALLGLEAIAMDRASGGRARPSPLALELAEAGWI